MYEHKQLFNSMLERVRQVGADNGLKAPQAFGRWFADMYFEEPRDFFYADGPGDAKVDLFFSTSNGKEVRHHVLNTKFTENYDSTAPGSFYNEITSFWQVFKNKANRTDYLENIARRDVRQHYSRLFDAYDDDRADLYFLTNSKRNERQVVSVANYGVEVFHLDDVLQFMADYIENAMPRTPELRLTGIHNVLSADKDETEIPTSIVFARLTDFHSYMKEDRYGLLFNRNVRVWLGRTEVNKAITDTFRDSPREFAFSHNGITVLCEGHTTQQGKHEIVITNPRVVNGAQTLHSIRDIPVKPAQQAARVMVRIIEIPPLGVDDRPAQAERRRQVIRKIALRSNSQNNIKKWDLVSNDEFQLNLARYFRTKKLFYERRRREWKERRTELRSVGVKRGPEVKRLAQLMASYYWNSKLLGPVAARNPAELFQGKEYEKIAESPSELAYQLFLLDAVITTHADALAESKQYVSNLARHMKYALLALIARTLQSTDPDIGSEEFARVIETEHQSPSARWRKFVMCAIDRIRSVYSLEDRRYRQREKRPLAIANFFKSQTYVSNIFGDGLPRALTSAARNALTTTH